MTAPRRQLKPLQVTTSGSIAGADLRGLAALLLKLDQQPTLRIVSNPQPAVEPPKHDGRE
jgi:hypothetical protein